MRPSTKTALVDIFLLTIVTTVFIAIFSGLVLFLLWVIHA